VSLRCGSSVSPNRTGSSSPICGCALTDAFGTADDQYLSEARFTAAQWRQRLRDHAQFAAFVGGRPAGLVAAYQQNTENVYLYSLWLDPDARGLGLASQLIAAALEWARRRSARTVSLRMSPDNRVARAVYESLGFTEVPGEGPAREVAMKLRIS